MKLAKLTLALIMASISSAALAGGPLYIHQPTMKPYKWDTSKGPIPVYTDGGTAILDKNGTAVEAFTILEKGTKYNLDLTLPDGTVIPKGTVLDRDMTFLTIDQANAITTMAVGEWSKVPTSTFRMTVQGTIKEKTGIADVNQHNVEKIYGEENGYGFWVNYDSDGQILEQYFGVPKTQVLGIAFPEWANEETGEITEATALMNGWFVDVSDTQGHKVAGVFTHEFGHAINMSHSQANGHLVYVASPNAPQYDGVPGCATTKKYTSSSQLAWNNIETMFPFINVRSDAGKEQSTVNVRDDIVNISDLYPTADYKTSFGSISGTLRTKEGVPYSGVNLVARNLDNPYQDVVTQQSGNMTQGKVGLDGTFTINGLTPGGRYVLYVENIKAGGYPTTPRAILSEAEYWNSNESANPAQDNACEATPIVAEAGVTKQADMYFNGYTDGIQYTPLIQAFITDHAKNGKRAMGFLGSTPFLYDSTKKSMFFTYPQNGQIKAGYAAMNKTATVAGVMSDLDGNGIGEATLWDLRSNKLTPIGDLNGNSCGGTGSSGTNASFVWDVDDLGETVVGTGYVDVDKDGNCQRTYMNEVVPFVWTKAGGMKQLPYQLDKAPQWLRADRVSGNGKTITGSYNGWLQVAWVNGQFRDIYTEFGAADSSVISADGRTIAFGTVKDGAKLWDTQTNQITSINGLRWCDDLPFNNAIQGNLCTKGWNHESLVARYGQPRALLLDATDDLSVITARIGSLLVGYTGAVYMKGIGWMSTRDFFAKQGVVEAKNVLVDNPVALSANGSEMMGNLAGATISIDINMNKAYVCDTGKDVELSFPKQVIAAVTNGAQFGRCAHLNDRY